MALLSVEIAWPLTLSAGYLAGLHRTPTALVGVFSCGLGGWMIVEAGSLHGLLFA